MDALILGGERLDARALGLDDGHGPPGAVAEHVVGARAVRQRMLEQDAYAVVQAPARVREQGVDPDPREGFRVSGHERTRFSRPRTRRRQGGPSSISVVPASSCASSCAPRRRRPRPRHAHPKEAMYQQFARRICDRSAGGALRPRAGARSGRVRSGGKPPGFEERPDEARDRRAPADGGVGTAHGHVGDAGEARVPQLDRAVVRVRGVDLSTDPPRGMQDGRGPVSRDDPGAGTRGREGCGRSRSLPGGRSGRGRRSGARPPAAAPRGARPRRSAARS